MSARVTRVQVEADATRRDAMIHLGYGYASEFRFAELPEDMQDALRTWIAGAS